MDYYEDGDAWLRVQDREYRRSSCSVAAVKISDCICDASPLVARKPARLLDARAHR